MSYVCVGMHVEIKRSDGRVHGAVVSAVRTNDRFVLEWNEKGDTKAKEVSLLELLETNPTLKPRVPVPKIQQVLELDDEDDLLMNTFLEQKNARQLRTTITSSENHPHRPSKESLKNVSNMVKPKVRVPAKITESLIDPEVEERVRAPVAPVARSVARTVPVPVSVEPPKPEPSVQQVRPQPPQRLQQQNILPANANYHFAQMIRDYRQNCVYTPLQMTDPVKDSRITVCVRNRPLNKKEVTRGEVEVVSTPNRDHLILHKPVTSVDLTKSIDNQKFRFDYVFDSNSTNELVYRFTAQPLVNTVFEGGTATCFAYGQTGSGKTHTMGGDFSGSKQDATMGIYALTARDVFKYLTFPENRKKKLSVHCAFFEIYGAKILDLLNGRSQLKILEDGKSQMQVVGLKEVDVSNEQDVLNLINMGSAVRTAGTTSANANSSRSHAIFQIILRSKKAQHGKISLIDLAGNERGQDTRDCDRERRLEGAEINKSMLSLKECIRAMACNSNHIPFRGSKLTMALRDSFTGEKSRTVMISMISPGFSSVEHSLNTLRYADRVKGLGTDDEVSTPMDDAEFMAAPVDSDEDMQEDEEAIDFVGEKIEQAVLAVSEMATKATSVTELIKVCQTGNKQQVRAAYNKYKLLVQQQVAAVDTFGKLLKDNDKM